MISYSHVALLILLDEPTGAEVTQQLGLAPTRIRANTSKRFSVSAPPVERTDYTWMLESPLDATHPPDARLHALIDVLEPHGARLLALDANYSRWIDLVFKVTPQRPDGITGEFDWLSLPADTMGRLARLQLSLSYETFWFDHPDWRRPAPAGAWPARLWRWFTDNSRDKTLPR